MHARYFPAATTSSSSPLVLLLHVNDSDSDGESFPRVECEARGQRP